MPGIALDLETVVALLFVGVLVYFSLDFDKHYSELFHNAARHPFMRFLAGLCLTLIASHNPVLASVGLIVVFFWIADIHLLSSLKL
jgi:succinate dehydrogenase hydrophobic anchor subunit